MSVEDDILAFIDLVYEAAFDSTQWPAALISLADNMKTRVLQPDGAWEHIWPAEGETPLNAQEYFVAQAREAVLRQGEE